MHLLPKLAAFSIVFFGPWQEVCAQISGTQTIPGDFPTITAALDAIDMQGLSGPTILELQSDYVSTFESYPIEFSLIPGISAVNTLTLRPAADASALFIASANNLATVSLLDVAYVIVDGRPGGSGSGRELTIHNSNPLSRALRFHAVAQHNVVQYCNLLGAHQTAQGGVVEFSSTEHSGDNSFNTISHCVIRDDGSGAPYVGIYASTSFVPSGGNVVSDNEISNFGYSGIFVEDRNDGGWSIVNNSFYNTLPVSPAGDRCVIRFDPGVDSDGNQIEGNFIGGHDVYATGAAWVHNGATTFTGIYLSAGSDSGTGLHNNVIQNLSLSSAGLTRFTGIDIASGITNNDGNSIGSSTYPITVSGLTTEVSGIVIHSSDEVSITNDDIGYITVTASAGGTSIHPIHYLGNAAVTITGNTIHDFTTNTTGSVVFTGIHLAGGELEASALHDNVIADLTLSSTSGIQMTGIAIASGLTSNNGNIVGSPSEAASIVVSGSSSTITGILITSSDEVSVEEDNIGNIVAMDAGGGVSFEAIKYSGGAAIAMNGNTIHDFSTTSIGPVYFNGLYLEGGGGTSSEVHYNTIQDIALTSSLSIQCAGINRVSGVTNNTGNTIGSSSEANSILLTAPTVVMNGIRISAGDEVSITDDEIGNITAIGSNAQVNGILLHALGDATISGNTIGQLTGSIVKGIGILCDGSSAMTAIENNILTGNGSGSGIEANVSGNAFLEIIIINNVISNWTTGIILDQEPLATVEPFIHGNTFEGNQSALEHQTDDLVDATCNWWGDESGPSGAGPGTGDAVGENVLFDPWSTILSFVSIDAGADQTIYIGYGVQSKNLTAISISCEAYEIEWSTGATSESITVSPTTTTSYTVTITDASGRSDVDAVTVFVIDIRCGNRKVYLCHNGNTICVNVAAVAAHLSHGDALGSCSSGLLAMPGESEPMMEADIFLQNFPNPFDDLTAIQYRVPERSHVHLSVLNLLNKSVSDLINTNMEAGEYRLKFDASDIPAGMYVCVLTTESVAGHKVQRWIQPMIIMR